MGYWRLFSYSQRMRPAVRILGLLVAALYFGVLGGNYAAEGHFELVLGIGIWHFAHAVPLRISLRHRLALALLFVGLGAVCALHSPGRPSLVHAGGFLFLALTYAAIAGRRLTVPRAGCTGPV